MWKQNLGLNFTITTYESGSYWDEFYDGNFDVAFDGWTGDYDDPNTMLECFTQKACATQTDGAVRRQKSTIRSLQTVRL